MLTDRQTLEFHIEAFNANASFGSFTGSTSVFPARQVQLALRLAF